MLDELKNRLEALSNPIKAKEQQRYFKTGQGEYGEGDHFLGIRVPVLRQMAKEYAELELDDTLQLLQSNIHEQRFVALVLLVQRFCKADSLGRSELYELYCANTAWINNWDLVDSSAPHIVGAYLFERDKGPLFKLACSSSLWERRIALLATFHFIRNNIFTPTLQIAETLINDPEDLIHKGVGWMLREVGKRNLALEEEFLVKYYQGMPRVMLRYAIEKMEEPKRKMYLRGEV